MTSTLCPGDGGGGEDGGVLVGGVLVDGGVLVGGVLVDGGVVVGGAVVGGVLVDGAVEVGGGGVGSLLLADGAGAVLTSNCGGWLLYRLAQDHRIALSVAATKL